MWYGVLSAIKLFLSIATCLYHFGIAATYILNKNDIAHLNRITIQYYM